MESDAQGPGPDRADHTGGRHHDMSASNDLPEDQDIFFTAVRMSGMPMIMADPRRHDCPIVFCNEAFEELTGYTQKEIIGNNCRFLQGADTDPQAVARIRAAVMAREESHEELFNYRKDGTGFWNELFMTPVFGPEGELLYFFASQLDVTRRHETNAILQQAQRLETLGSMASCVVHEITDLMTVVSGSLEQLKCSAAVSGLATERLERAAWAAGQAGRLAQQMLSLARSPLHDNQEVDINGCLGNVESLLRKTAGADIQLAVELSVEKLRVKSDPVQMEMALLNLVRNAADAMPQQGHLAVRTRRMNANGLALAVVEVSDCGSGMSPEIKRRATEPFFTTKAQGTGAGLGLTMVSGFVAQSGGALEIASEIGQGTTVALSFPLLPDV